MNPLTTFHAVDAKVNAAGDVVADGIYSSRLCRHGPMKWLTTDYGVGQMLALCGEYSEGEVALFRRFIRWGDVVISAGGNIGAHLVPLSKIVGSDGRVITFEPQSFLWPLLEENMRVNGCGNVEVHHAGLGDAPGEGHLANADPTVPNNFGGLHLIREGDVVGNNAGGMTIVREGMVSTTAVAIRTIDSLELARLDFLMLDVEGYEEAALRGAAATIARCRPLLYVEIDKEDKREPLLHFITDELRYEVLFHLPYVFSPDNFAGNTVNHFPDMRSIMCLVVPR